MLNENILPPTDPAERFMRLASDLHTVVNYDQLLEDSDKKGLCMKEDKDFYIGRVISDLKVLLNGKTKEEIAILLRDVYELSLV